MKEIYILANLSRFIVFISTLFFFIMQGSSIHAQQTNVTIKIIDTKKQPVPFASVTARGVKDSTQAFNKVSDSSGITKFDL